MYLSKIEKRIRTYTITQLNPPREGKKLLVLDIDYTLFDHRSSAETGKPFIHIRNQQINKLTICHPKHLLYRKFIGIELMRPHLHEFLTSAYEDYDIVIWSATGMRWIVEKMNLLGVHSNQSYKIMFYICSSAMISIYHSDLGVVDVKPLGVIWGKYQQYSAKNTIMFDDISRNFLMNPQSGLKIRAFRQAHLNRDKDTELLKLGKYLKDIAKHCEDFSQLNHRKWERYNPGK